MEKLIIKPVKNISGTITVPADKSISHRAVMFGSIAEGTTVVKNFLDAEDCNRTIDAFRQMGVEINKGRVITIKGVGLYGLRPPGQDIYCGNSGTTMRLLSGILAGQGFRARLTGDKSLSARPMKRIAGPLIKMGASVIGNHSPLVIQGNRLKPIDFVSPVASAQVKSCILLAGLYAEGMTTVSEPSISRDHTERMLCLFGVDVKRKDKKVSIKGGQKLRATDIEVPGDISSAAFFIVAASILKNSRLKLKSVGINPTRTGVLDILKAMNAKIKIENKSKGPEPSADLVVESSRLKATTIKGSIIPRSIDELPVIMVAATQAKGITKILGAKELRVKETDRIKSISEGLNKMGADIKVAGDNIYIKGPTPLKAASLKSLGDHRTAMSFAIAGLAAEGKTTIKDTECILTSFPDFKQTLSKISRH